MLIKLNDSNWTPGERESIIDRALELYLSKKRRKRKIDDNNSEEIINCNVADYDENEIEAITSDDDYDSDCLDNETILEEDIF